MDKQLSTSSAFLAANPNGHTFAVPLMLQAVCTTCWYVASYETACKDGIPPCKGRVASVQSRGHWLEGDTCKLCKLTFPSFHPIAHAYEDERTAPVGIVQLRQLPVCSRCDHTGALESVSDGDARVAQTRLDAIERNGGAAHVCTACGAEWLTLKVASGS